jgi:hypothetical protein
LNELFILCARFLSLAQLIIGDLPMMDSAALTALVDRWHPETHMFHLLCGETTVTLQDVVMILGLPIDDTPVCGGWRDSVKAAIGMRPPMFPQTRRTRRLWAFTPDGSQLTSTPTRRVLRTPSFRGMLDLAFGIWMTSGHFLI